MTVLEWTLLALALVLVLACGIFVAAEFALVTVNRGSVETAARAGDRSAQGVQAALQSLSTQLSGAQVGITVTNLSIGYLAEPAIAALVETPLTGLGVPAGAVPGAAVGIGLTVATLVTMIFGELVPKNLALARPLGTAKATQLVQRGFTAAMRWPIRLLNGSANALLRRIGVEPQEELRSMRTAQELSSLVERSASEGTLDTATAGLVQRSVAFSDRTADEIMTPRVQLVAVDASSPLTTVLDLTRSTGHSRFPVIAGSFDNVVGAVHVKHVVPVPRDRRATTPVREVMVEPTVVPASLRLDPLLALLREEGFQIAVVVDEFGGTAGVVTLEDVVEEIVGDISDEHDPFDEHIRRRGEHTWSLSGLLRPDEAAEATGVALPEEDHYYDTVAGLVLRRLGRIPEVGDTVAIALRPVVEDGATDEPGPEQVAVLEVERMSGRRVDQLRLSVGSDVVPAGQGSGGPR